MFEEAKNEVGQVVSGSPAQIWTELDLLATEIFGSSYFARLWADRFESLNRTAVSSELAPELQGFDCLTAGCVTYSNLTQHNTTQHNAMNL